MYFVTFLLMEVERAIREKYDAVTLVHCDMPDSSITLHGGADERLRAVLDVVAPGYINTEMARKKLFCCDADGSIGKRIFEGVATTEAGNHIFYSVNASFFNEDLSAEDAVQYLSSSSCSPFSKQRANWKDFGFNVKRKFVEISGRTKKTPFVEDDGQDAQYAPHHIQSMVIKGTITQVEKRKNNGGGWFYTKDPVANAIRGHDLWHCYGGVVWTIARGDEDLFSCEIHNPFDVGSDPTGCRSLSVYNPTVERMKKAGDLFFALKRHIANHVPEIRNVAHLVRAGRFTGNDRIKEMAQDFFKESIAPFSQAEELADLL
jgi:hypothetical protein